MITRRNVPGYPPQRSDAFHNGTEALGFYKQVVVTIPRVSLGNKLPSPPPTIDEYTAWLIDEGLFGPVLNPTAPVKNDA